MESRDSDKDFWEDEERHDVFWDGLFAFVSCLVSLGAVPIAVVLPAYIGEVRACIMGMIIAALAVTLAIGALGAETFRTRVLATLGLVVGSVSLWAFGVALALGHAVAPIFQLPD
jgi:hypothetical protein